jgi:predicted nicotinamide N-methyase
MSPEDRRRFVIEHTTVGSAPLVPEIRLHIGGSSMPLWEAAALADLRPAVPPPYWAWPWPGGQALARYLLDHPETVRGLSVVDVGAGGGIVAIAAALAGAGAVAAIDVEPFAIAACRLNADLNHARIGLFETDPIGSDDGWDIVLAGDTWYEPELGARMAGWLRGLAARGALVLTGDLGRSHLPSSGLVELARVSVPTSLDLEDTDSKLVRVLRFVAG